ncbi:unnamed protein product, partial [Brenthis ino]
MPLSRKRFQQSASREIICNSGFFFLAMLNLPAETVLSYWGVMGSRHLPQIHMKDHATEEYSSNSVSNDNEARTTSSNNNSSRPPKPCKTKRKDESLANEVLESVRDHFKRPRPIVTEERCDIIGKYVAMKLRALDAKQIIVAEKLINDLVFETEIGNLTPEHAYINMRDILKQNQRSYVPAQQYRQHAYQSSPNSNRAYAPKIKEVRVGTKRGASALRAVEDESTLLNELIPLNESTPQNEWIVRKGSIELDEEGNPIANNGNAPEAPQREIIRYLNCSDLHKYSLAEDTIQLSNLNIMAADNPCIMKAPVIILENNHFPGFAHAYNITGKRIVMVDNEYKGAEQNHYIVGDKVLLVNNTFQGNLQLHEVAGYEVTASQNVYDGKIGDETPDITIAYKRRFLEDLKDGLKIKRPEGAAIVQRFEELSNRDFPMLQAY